MALGVHYPAGRAASVSRLLVYCPANNLQPPTAPEPPGGVTTRRNRYDYSSSPRLDLRLVSSPRSRNLFAGPHTRSVYRIGRATEEPQQDLRSAGGLPGPTRQIATGIVLERRDNSTRACCPSLRPPNAVHAPSQPLASGPSLMASITAAGLHCQVRPLHCRWGRERPRARGRRSSPAST